MPGPERLDPPRLALANLRAKPYRSAGLALVVALSAFVLFGGSLLSGGVKTGLDSLAERLGADLMVVPRGYADRMQAVLLRGEPSSFYLGADLLERLRSVPGAARLAPQLYLASLDDACCAYPIQIIGYDPETDFVVPPWMTANRKTRPNPDEIVVGSLITSPVGTKSSFFGDLFRVAARLDRTGMGFDTSIFMPIDTARGLLRKGGRSSPLAEVPEASVSSILVSLEPGTTPLKFMGDARRELGREFQFEFVVARDLVTDLANRLELFSIPLILTTIFVWLGAVGILFLFFSVLANERKRELALFRILGAGRSRVNRMILWEALILSGSGAFLGLAAAAVSVLPFQSLILESAGLPYLAPGFAGIAGLALFAALASLAIGPLASLHALLRNGRREIYAGLRSGE
ncbi:MAG: ABC transporter permease [Planctomycetota bacterium]|jgi:putative ABC transport system permease protein|nr:ABC transporter permease [Planctomycetota bacterium]